MCWSWFNKKSELDTAFLWEPRRVNKAELYPLFLERCEKLINEAARKGHEFYVISGLRTFEEQDELYAKGRTEQGSIVTNAKGGQSMHNYGLAIDVCYDDDLDKAGLQPNWDKEKYAIIGKLCAKYGLEWGGNFKQVDVKGDVYHIQLPIDRYDIDYARLMRLYEMGGLERVWDNLDRYDW